MRRAILAAAALAAAGCVPTAPVQSLALVAGDVTATAPDGFCIDQAASKPRAGFAVIAPCASLGGDGSVPAVVGVATVQVGAAGSGTVAGAETTLRDLLVSPAGATLLSTRGEGVGVRVIGSQVFDNAVKVHFSDTAPPPLPGLQDQEWRAFLDIGGRLVTVGVRGLVRAPLADGTGAWLLDRVIAGLAARPEADAPQAPTDDPQ